ncbi:MAG TPA: hypothetical protein DCZ91_25340 [Lachnospiraceae bacterium]|nr:hypothetical protein [Lachnospiraceae bacterium]
MFSSFSLNGSAACGDSLPVPLAPVQKCGLLVGGIRSAGFASMEEKLIPLVVNSLLETNLGMPYIFVIFTAYSRRFTEQLSRREQTLAFTERIQEWNRQRVYNH